MTNYEFDPGYMIRHIVLVGVGGTGAQIARGLARLLYDMRERRVLTPAVTFFDPDHVEARNIGRQLFAPADIGANKAVLCAARLNVTLGLNIAARARAFTAADAREIAGWHYPGSKDTLLIGAVDNAAARQELANALPHACAWIDCGNHEHGGQVIIGNSDKLDHKEYKPSSAAILPKPQDTEQRRLSYGTLPAPHIVFPELLQPDPEPLSCADLAAQNRQALFINDWMAMVAVEYVRKLLMREPLRTWITYVNAQHLNMRSVLVSPETIKAMLEQAAPATAKPKKAQGRR